jgi:hypothetical protein
MKRIIAAVLTIALAAPAFAGISGDKAAYRGGTITGVKQGKEAVLDVADPNRISFVAGGGRIEIPYDKIQTIEYGQKAGRRVGAAIATAVLVSPIGLFMLFSKKRVHMVSLTWTNAEGKTDAAVFEVGKNAIRSTLKTIEARSGKETEYETPEAKANLGK